MYAITKPKPDFVVNQSLMKQSTVLPSIKNNSNSNHSSILPTIRNSIKPAKEFNLRDDTKNIKEKLYSSENDVNEFNNIKIGYISENNAYNYDHPYLR